MHHWDIRTCYHHVERTRFSIDPSFDVLILEKKFKRRGFRKSDTNKKREGEREKERKEGKEKRKEEKKEKWERGNDCFTMIDTCSLARLITTSLNSYAFYEFPAFFWPVPIFVHAFSIHALELRARAPVRTERRQIDLIDESNALH